MIEIEQDHDVAAVLDQALGLLDHHLGDLHVPRRRLVEGRGHDLALHRALHVGHFLRPLVDQQHDQVAFRMIGRDGVRDVLQQARSCRCAAATRSSARWPLPIGATMSMTRGERSFLVGSSCSIRSRSSG